jgi:hypothetical protein
MLEQFFIKVDATERENATVLFSNKMDPAFFQYTGLPHSDC